MNYIEGMYPGVNDVGAAQQQHMMEAGIGKIEPQDYDGDKMTLWAEVQKLQGEPFRQVQSLYGVHFPIEVRHIFAQWIEAQPWFQIDEDNLAQEEVAIRLREEIISMIEEKARELDDADMFLYKVKFHQTVPQFRETYGNRPMDLVRVMKNCLNTEQRLVDTYITGNAGVDDTKATAHRQIMHQFEFLTQCTQETEANLRTLLQEQENFIIHYQEGLKINAQLQQLQSQPNGQSRMEGEQRLNQQKEAIDKELKQMAQGLLDHRLSLAKKHKQAFDSLTTLQSHILDEQLITYKRQQQLAGNGAPFEGSLETLQQWCESLAELIWQNRQQIKRVELLRQQLPINLPPGEIDLLPYLNDTITGLLSSLVTSTFIIEKQPPQVLKKDAKFTSTVRLLVGGKLNVHMNPPTVQATIISEEQARAILKNDKNAKNEVSGDILNNQGTMEYHQANGQLAVTFRNMQLKRIRRAEKKGNETVTEEKFSILFQSQFKVASGELVFQVWTLSLPVVVTVHGNQECNALATVLWDNAFAEAGRVPFMVPDRVLWPALAQTLNTKFASQTGMGLSQTNLSYLASKLFGESHGSIDDYTLQYVTWSQFNREPLPGRNFTFWEWFYAVLKLTKDWLQGPWKARLIIGFISKQKSQEWLLMKPNGTFLLRFSDSEVGGITIAWVAEDPNKQGAERQVWNLAPFTEKDFKIRGLGDRVNDLGNLLYLYPDISKATAFSKFWTQCPDANNLQNNEGYVRPDLTTVIPGLMSRPAAPLSYDDPRTPQSQPMMDSTYATSAATPHAAAQPDQTMDMNDQGGGDMLDFFTDYNPGDIDQINVNDILSQ